ncbi:MAG TPA: choice-of-anchor tandem repeat GloVer-containing protein [Candidatus Sulfotelmatobacter sp.]|nr:choice-of-anchor tandem repeat GloVer-containing protein [Candidatus Sulfotelmatobacter sp.]
MKHSKASQFTLLFLVIAVATSVAQAQTFTDLFDFDGTAHGCCASYPGVLAQGRDGNLYGTTLQGGANGRGTVFKATLSGTVTVLHSFNVTDGMGPQGGLTLGMDGNFYGTTNGGGANSKGTVYKVTPSGTYTVIHDFTGTGDGGFPHASPIAAPDGNLYGPAGLGSSGIIYKITPTGTLTPIATLGLESDSTLTLGVDGKLYGVTQVGGTNNRGTVFSVTTAGVLKTIFSFNDPTGATPYGPILQAVDGNFYGTSYTGGSAGGGVVYKMTPAGVFTVIHNFDSSNRALGINPITGMVQGSDGFLYGVTAGGGASFGGTIFKLKTDGSSFAVVHSFDVTHGSSPYSLPTLHTNGKIYGLTNLGGAHNDGTLYSLANGLKSFASPVVRKSAKVGVTVGILGQNLTTTTQVLFGTGAGTFTASSNTYMTAKIVAGATTGQITVKEPGGNLLSPQKFKIVPSITSFTPPNGPVGTSVIITGVSLSQTTAVKFNGKAATFTVNSDTQVSATVPTGATTGKISVTTQGGTATSTTNFTVN